MHDIEFKGLLAYLQTAKVRKVTSSEHLASSFVFVQRECIIWAEEELGDGDLKASWKRVSELASIELPDCFTDEKTGFGIYSVLETLFDKMRDKNEALPLGNQFPCSICKLHDVLQGPLLSNTNLYHACCIGF